MEISNPAFSYLAIFFPMFIVIYLIGYYGVFRNWSPKHRPEASSCFISFAHGTPAAVLAALSIISQPVPAFASPNTNFQNLVLEFSIAYFLVDLLHYLVFNPSDVLFIGHHVATLFVLLTCRYLVYHGSFAILVVLILAEVTSFCQNTWTLAGSRRADVPFAAKLYRFLSPPFYAFYALVRGLVAPFFAYKMGQFYLSGEADHVIPRLVWLSWMLVVVIGILVSLLWIFNLCLELHKERIERVEQKKKIG